MEERATHRADNYKSERAHCILLALPIHDAVNSPSNTIKPRKPLSHRSRLHPGSPSDPLCSNMWNHGPHGWVTSGGTHGA
jgi:hypothetical protein